MSRYNHRLIERKWIARWQEEPTLERRLAQTVLIAPDEEIFSLENIRLLLLTDFLSLLQFGTPPLIEIAGASPQQLSTLSILGLSIAPFSGRSPDLIVCPRDYSLTLSEKPQANVQLVGRYFADACAVELLGDFGVDALRLHFLQLGPLGRDYSFNWHGFVAAYRFLQRLWSLAGQIQSGPNNFQTLDLELYTAFSRRLAEGKPHTAFAAISQFLRKQAPVSALEFQQVLSLLRPYVPFLAAEILTLDSADLTQ